jgi:hypothetical protein
MNDTIESLKTKLAQLKELHVTGVLPDTEFAEGKSTLERRILELVLSGEPTPVSQATPAAPAAPGTAAAAPASGAAPRAAAAPVAAASTTAAKPSGLMLAGLAVAVAVLAAGGYLW